MASTHPDQDRDYAFADRALALRERAGLTQQQLAALLGASRRSIQDWEAGLRYPGAERLKELLAFYLGRGMLLAGQEEREAAELWEAARAHAARHMVPFDRSLLVLDNLETVLEPGTPEGRYRAEAGYGRVLQRLGEAEHQGCLLLTSREKPPELDLLEGAATPVRTLRVSGLSVETGRALLQDKQLAGDAATWETLVERYGGNALALKVVGETISVVFGGDIAAFLSQGEAVFGSIRRLLDTQVERLSALERSAMIWLAVAREPMSFVDLAAAIGKPVARGAVLEALEALRRRSLIEPGERGATFTLQSVVLEYVTDRMVATAFQEISENRAELVCSHALIQAQAADYIRRSQERLIAQPLLDRLVGTWGGASAVEQRLGEMLEGWRGRPAAEQGYGPGNVVNLVRLLRGDLRGLDLSRLSIRQAYLQEVDAQDARLAHSHLAQSVLAEDFYNVFSVAFSADGSFLAAGTADSEVRLWRVADRTPILSAHGHSGGLVVGVAVNANGRLVASAGNDGLVNLWDGPSGRLLATLRGHDGQAQDVALSADGRLLASVGFDGIMRLWETGSGRLLAGLKGHVGHIHGVAMSADGQLVASGGLDGTVRLWDAAGGRLLATLEAHAGGAWDVAMSDDGRLLASGGLDGAVNLWTTTPIATMPRAGLVDARTGPGNAPIRLLATLQGHTSTVYGVAVSGAGDLVASGDFDGLLKLWEAPGGRCLATVRAHTGGIFDVAVSGDGRLVASSGLDGTVKLWEAESGRQLATLQGHCGIIYDVSASADGRLLASGGDDGVVRLWGAQDGDLLATMYGHSGIVYSVALSADGRVLASGGEDGTVRLWEAPGGRLAAILRGHDGWVRGIALSGDGRLVASGGQDGTVRLWSGDSGLLQTTLRGHSGLVFDVALSGDARLIASGGFDRTVRLWTAENGQQVAMWQGDQSLVFAVALSADGRLLAGGGVEGTISLWETTSGRLLATLPGHAGPIFGLALSADGGLLASSGVDGTINLWETAGTRPLATLRSHGGIVYSLALSADGHQLASGGDDGVVKLWDLPGGTCLLALRPDRRYERLDITGLSGITDAQKAALLAQGAIDIAHSS
jgi:WD40 repeat protein/transcriptional regulator with XRE-family HTH domain